MASGGAIYIRDPHHRVLDAQLNGGEFQDMSPADWEILRPVLGSNADAFGITIDRLLTVDDVLLPPEQVYRKVSPVVNQALHAESAWVGHRE